MFKNYTFDKKDPAQCHAFDVHGLDLSIVNGIRRTILTDIEVVGFSGEEEPSLEVVTNTGRLHNEIIMHRIGLIPIHLDDVVTEGFTDGDYTIELQKGNTSDEMINVTTHDIQVYKDGKRVPDTVVMNELFPADKVSHEPILITRLRPNERLHVNGSAVKRTARFHAGFSPVSHCTFYYMRDEKEAAKATNILDKERAYLRNEYGDPIAYHFEIEPKGKLLPRYLVSKAFDIIIKKMVTLQNELYQEDSTYVEVKEGDTGGMNFTFNQEDDTLGNIIQSYIHVHNIRAKVHAPHGAEVTYVGYYCPHPLDPTVVVNIRMSEGRKKEYVDFLAASARSIVALLQDTQNAWLQFAPKN